METTLSSLPLTSLTVWSMQHIRDVFEASSDEEALQALDNTFARNVEATVNGRPIQYQDIQGMVLALRKGSRLKVSWQQARELPDDASTNQVRRLYFWAKSTVVLMSGCNRAVYSVEHMLFKASNDCYRGQVTQSNSSGISLWRSSECASFGNRHRI